MKSLRFLSVWAFVSLALAGFVRADEKTPAVAAPAACTCDGCCAASAAKDQKDGAAAKPCCCAGAQSKPVEKVMPKPSYNRKS